VAIDTEKKLYICLHF